jgi:hypothetical protein
LGSTVHSENKFRTDTHIPNLRQKTEHTWSTLISSGQILKQQIKGVCVLKPRIRPILTYASEAWTTVEETRALRITEWKTIKNIWGHIKGGKRLRIRKKQVYKEHITRGRYCETYKIPPSEMLLSS